MLDINLLLEAADKAEANTDRSIVDKDKERESSEIAQKSGAGKKECNQSLYET